MNVPDDLLYTKDHEWVRREGAAARIGITDYAQGQLGDIVYVDLPAVGSTIEAGVEFGTVESVKAVSEIFAPITGDVLEVNEVLRDSAETVNGDPYGDGWIVRSKPTVPIEIGDLMDAAAYRKHLETAEKH